MFLGTHSVICSYGAIVGVLAFAGYIDENRIWEIGFVNLRTGEKIDANWNRMFQFLYMQYTAFCFVVILCAIMSVVLGGFFLYHFIIIASRNRTTSERFKVATYTSFLRERQREIVTFFMETYKDLDLDDEIDKWKSKNPISGNTKEVNKRRKLLLRKEIDLKPENKPDFYVEALVLAEREIAMLKENAYNKGRWNNIKEVMFPPRT